jgi:hypothetical protein
MFMCIFLPCCLTYLIFADVCMWINKELYTGPDFLLGQGGATAPSGLHVAPLVHGARAAVKNGDFLQRPAASRPGGELCGGRELSEVDTVRPVDKLKANTAHTDAQCRPARPMGEGEQLTL